MRLFYFIDITDYVTLQKTFELQNVVFGYLMIDNYDDVLNSAPEVSKSNIASEIERRVMDWFYNQIRSDVFLMKYERDKYLFICNTEAFYKMQERRFNILDQIKEVNLYNRIIPTISCGIGIRDDSIFQAQKMQKQRWTWHFHVVATSLWFSTMESLNFMAGRQKSMKNAQKSAHVSWHRL